MPPIPTVALQQLCWAAAGHGQARRLLGHRLLFSGRVAPLSCTTKNRCPNNVVQPNPNAVQPEPISFNACS